MFDRFELKQLTFEVRYEPAFRIWDHTGAFWTDLQQLGSVELRDDPQPNRTALVLNGRYNVLLGLQTAHIIDFSPKRSFDSDSGVMSEFNRLVSYHLDIPVFNRVGTRAIYQLDLKEEHEVYTFFNRSHLYPNKKRFGVEPQKPRLAFTVHVEDDQLGYSVRCQGQTKSMSVQVGPEMRPLSPQKATLHQVTYDVDIYSVAPFPVASLSVEAWLEKCRRSINRDSDEVLREFLS